MGGSTWNQPPKLSRKYHYPRCLGWEVQHTRVALGMLSVCFSAGKIQQINVWRPCHWSRRWLENLWLVLWQSSKLVLWQSSTCPLAKFKFSLAIGLALGWVGNLGLVLWQSSTRPLAKFSLTCPLAKFSLPLVSSLVGWETSDLSSGKVCLAAEWINDPYAGSPTKTLLRLLLSTNTQVHLISQLLNPLSSPKYSIDRSDGRCVQKAGT